MKSKSFALIMFLVFLLVSVVMLAGCGSSVNTAQGEEENSVTAELAPCLTKATYLYRFNDWENAAKISSLKKMGITMVFLSTTAKNLPGGPYFSTTYVAKMIDFLTRAKEAGISIHLLVDQTYEDGLVANHSNAKEKVRLAVDFIRENPVLAVQGISLDIEIHVLKEWKNNPAGYGDSVREGLMQQYVLLLSEIREFLNGPEGLPGLQFSAATGWFYPSRAGDGTVPSAAPSNLGKYVDFIIPMAYDLSPTVIKQASGSIAGAPTMVAIKINNFSSYRGIFDQFNALVANYRLKKNYRGVVFFEFSDLEEKYSQATTGNVSP